MLRCRKEPQRTGGFGVRRQRTVSRRRWLRRADADYPTALRGGVVQQTPHGSYKLLQQDEGYLLHVEVRGEWQPLNVFTTQPQRRADLEVGVVTRQPILRRCLSPVWWQRLSPTRHGITCVAATSPCTGVTASNGSGLAARLRWSICCLVGSGLLSPTLVTGRRCRRGSARFSTPDGCTGQQRAGRVVRCGMVALARRSRQDQLVRPEGP
jgi:N-acetyltransferase